MAKRTDIQIQSAAIYFLPVEMRMPLKFGAETLTHITCARVQVVVVDQTGKTATGWGETPLSVQWVWPSVLSYAEREQALRTFSLEIAKAWATFNFSGHPIEIGHAFQTDVLPNLLAQFNHNRKQAEPMPYLAALVCCSAFDIALHDAYGIRHNTSVYETYNDEWMNVDLSAFLTPAAGTPVSFNGHYPQNYFSLPRPQNLPVWHLVGGLDPLHAYEKTGGEPTDEYPVLLRDWIRRDGLTCLKIKLRGNDSLWDYNRTVQVGQIGLSEGVRWLTCDFNCTVKDPAYVNDILDRLMIEHPPISQMILYVEQPFPYDLENNQIDVHSVSARKPLFMDESAHDWHLIRLGRQLGWTGVALKTCKTQTGALLSFCWAKANGMTLMVQDLTNPMIAQVSHALLAAYVGTIMGLESNAPQFCPNASLPEAAIHPGLYRRQNGVLNISTIGGPGFGYRLDQIKRNLPEAAAVY